MVRDFVVYVDNRGFPLSRNLPFGDHLLYLISRIPHPTSQTWCNMMYSVAPPRANATYCGLVALASEFGETVKTFKSRKL